MFHWLGPEPVSNGMTYDNNRGRNQPRKPRGVSTDTYFSANLAWGGGQHECWRMSSQVSKEASSLLYFANKCNELTEAFNKGPWGNKSLKITIPVKSFVLINVTLYSIPPQVMLDLRKCKTVN